MKPRVILIRENAETLTCSSCAGTLEGIDAFCSSNVPDYAPARQVISQVGELYMSLRREFGDEVELDVVDPRNEVYRVPRLISDYRRYRPSMGSFLKTLFFGISPRSIIINGMVRHAGELPSPMALVEEVRVYIGENNQGKKTVPEESL